MRKLKIYLDTCCYNRPFDMQDQELVQLETLAKLCIQDRIKRGLYTLVWSYMLDFENAENPYEFRRVAIGFWDEIASVYEEGGDEISTMSKNFIELGLHRKDSIHLACAVRQNCDYIITTDKNFLKKNNQIAEIEIVNPVIFLFETGGMK